MLDVLAVGAHPDDCEIFMGGTLLALRAQGKKVGVLDLTQGEMGTKGSRDTRINEAADAAKFAGLNARWTLNLGDGKLKDDENASNAVIEIIREARPEIIFTSISNTRHPDHGTGGDLVVKCAYLAGLEKITTRHQAFRPSAVIRYGELGSPQNYNFVMDISPFYKKKIELIRKYKSQFSAAPKKSGSLIFSSRMWTTLEARAVMAGAMIDADYGEGFFCERVPRIADLASAFSRKIK